MHQPLTFYIHIYIYTYPPTYIHTYMHACIHTYIYIIILKCMEYETFKDMSSWIRIFWIVHILSTPGWQYMYLWNIHTSIYNPIYIHVYTYTYPYILGKKDSHFHKVTFMAYTTIKLYLFIYTYMHTLHYITVQYSTLQLHLHYITLHYIPTYVRTYHTYISYTYTYISL